MIFQRTRPGEYAPCYTHGGGNKISMEYETKRPEQRARGTNACRRIKREEEKEIQNCNSNEGQRTQFIIFQQIQQRPSTPSYPHHHHPQSIRTGQKKSKRQQLSRIWARVTGFPGCRANTYRHRHNRQIHAGRRLACRALGYFLFRLFQSESCSGSSVVCLVKGPKRHWGKKFNIQRTTMNHDHTVLPGMDDVTMW